MNAGFTDIPFRYQIALAAVRTRFVPLPFKDLSQFLFASFRTSAANPAVPNTCCISAFVCPAAPLQTICKTVEALYGEMKILEPGWFFETCFNSLKAKSVFAKASFC